MANNITIDNSTITILSPSADLLDFVRLNLSYTDKSKQYQLKRMQRNIWQRNSPLYKQLQSEVDGELFEYDVDKLTLSSCFFDLLTKEFPGLSIVDNRRETGSKIVLPWKNKPFDLRDYQEEAVQLMLSNPKGLINLATGLGKTLLTTHLIQRYKKRALIVCPSESVAKQFYEQFESCFGKQKVGFYGGGRKKISELTVGIAASITKNIKEFQQADLGVVIFDETHHTPATTFFDISQGLASVGKVFGLTATDYRSDGKDVMITAGCGPVLIRRDIKWGIENKWLAEPSFIVRKVLTDGRDVKDDKLKSYKEHVLNCQIMKDRISGDAAKMMGAGKSTLILVDEVAHGLELSRQLGIPFATGVDAESQSYLDQLNAGKVPGLVATDGKLGEGSDTRNVDVLILANFCGSKGPVIQAVGRGLRRQGDKTRVLVLDYIPLGSTMLKRHGFNRVKFYQEITDKVAIVE
jgi:superfamily II DNA or RNA helicase